MNAASVSKCSMHRRLFLVGKFTNLCNKIPRQLFVRSLAIVSALDPYHLHIVLKNYTVFVNVHKYCMPRDARMACEAVRFAQLLSARRVIVSQRCIEADEEEFKDMVLFEDDLFQSKWSSRTMEALRRPELFATRAHDLFRAKFDSTQIFKRAGVWTR